MLKEKEELRKYLDENPHTYFINNKDDEKEDVEFIEDLRKLCRKMNRNEYENVLCC